MLRKLKFFGAGALLVSLPAVMAADLKFDAYGFIKASYLTADSKVQSYGSGGVGAITQAAFIDESDATSKEGNTSRRFAFQSMQSRFGFKINQGEKVSGKLEFDFINFAQRSPSPSANIRLRIAQVNYKFSENTTLMAGQKWVTWMGVLPHTYNFVQSNLRSGNTGFIGQEMTLKHVLGDFHLYGAIGSRGKNNKETVNDNDYGVLPQVTLRTDYDHGKGIVGLAGTWAPLETETQDKAAGTLNGRDGNAFLYKAYGSFKHSIVDFRMEYFVGQNIDELYALGLGREIYSSSNGSIKSHGGFASVKVDLTKQNGLWLGYGMAQSVDGEKLVSLEIKDSNDIPALISNSQIAFGIDHRMDSGLTAFFETQMFDSEYKLSNDNHEKKSFDATVFEAGIVYKF